MVETRNKFDKLRNNFTTYLIKKKDPEIFNDKEKGKYFKEKISNYLTKTQHLVDNGPVERKDVEKY